MASIPAGKKFGVMASRDGSGNVDKEFEGITALRLPQDFGKTRSRNIGSAQPPASLNGQ